MQPFAIELEDRALALARAGRVLACAPSAVFDGSGAEPPGTPAWGALRRMPTATSTRHLSTVAARATPPREALALLGAELQQRLQGDPPGDAERVWFAVPARIDAGGLGALLGLTRGLSLPVAGFVDAAAVSVAALGIEQPALVLELGLHHLAATAVDTDGRVRRRRAVVSDRGGLIELYEAWLDLISAVMVKRTRFDPLHDGATEQQLFDSMPALTREAARTGSATAAAVAGTERFEAPLTRDQFTEAAQPIYRELLRLLHELRPAGAPVALLLPQAVAELPGVREALEQFVGCELLAVPDGFAAAATSLLDLPAGSEQQDVVHLVRRLPRRAERALVPQVARARLGEQRVEGPQPSHVLLEGRAFALGEEPLVVGRAPGAPHAIQLPEGLAGVSRRHCTFLRDRGELVLVDHSGFGTFVNGERVAERVRVHAGDRVRIGEPGVELALIAVGGVAAGDRHGAAQA